MTSPMQFMLGDLDEHRFVREYRGRAPVLSRGRVDRFATVFGLADFNRILNFSPLHYPRVRVTDHANTIHKYDLIEDKDRYANNVNNTLSPRRTLAAIARGGTLVFDRIEEHHAPLEDFIDALSHHVRHHVGANAYYTASGQDGVNVHFDRHDVFALQLHGSKRWYFRQGTRVLAKAIRHQQVPPVDAQCTGWESVLIEEGDIFYCPRGVWHFTRTESRHSLHLAVGMYPQTLGDWLRAFESDPALAAMLEEYIAEPQAPSGASPDPSLVERFVAEIRRHGGLPLPSAARTPRSHLELE
jgi:ribosomal protein L16 Arg81 hydroxylase